MNRILIVLLLFGAAFTRAQDPASDPPPAESEAPTTAGKLVTRAYNVPKTFLGSLSEHKAVETGPHDPFASPAEKEPAPVEKRSFTVMLEGIGLTFGPGASAVWNPETSKVALHNTEKEHAIFTGYLDALAAASEHQIHMLLEYIEVEQAEFSNWVLSHHFEYDATEFRAAVQEWIDDKDAVIVESSVATARSGQRAKVESIREYIYPTEYDPPEIPNQVSLSGRAESPVTGITPTAYETRNLGHTFEFDPVIDTDVDTIHVNLAPELVTLAGFSSWPHEDADPLFRASMPSFYTMKITTATVVRNGRYGFIGSTRPLAASSKRIENPIVLHFLRADVSRLGEWSVVEEEGEEKP